VTGVRTGEPGIERDWDKVDGKKQKAGFRDRIKHIEKNDQLFVTRMV